MIPSPMGRSPADASPSANVRGRRVDRSPVPSKMCGPGQGRAVSIAIAMVLLVACSAKEAPSVRGVSKASSPKPGVLRRTVKVARTLPGSGRRVDPPASRRSSEPWPAFPKSSAKARELLRSHRRRETVPNLLRALDAPRIASLVSSRVGVGRVFAGWSAIIAYLQRRATAAAAAKRPFFFLVGTYHDARGQINAFRRLVGPLGVHGGAGATRPLTVVVEQFDATGSWRGVTPSLQRGDDALLSRYQRDGGFLPLRAILSRQAQANYTAWKYRYLPSILDVVVMARASGQGMVSCDMPRPLQDWARSIAGEQLLLRLRELHCWLALSHQRVSDTAVAMLWGQDHIGPEGFARLVPKNAEVIALYLFGRRPTASGLEASLGRRFALTHPLLMPLSSSGVRAASYSQLLLLLPGRALGARWEQARDETRKTRPSSTLSLPLSREARRLIVSSTVAGRFLLHGRRVALKAEGRVTISLRAIPQGEAFVFRDGRGHLLVGSLELLRQGETLTLEFDPPHRVVRAIVIPRR